VPAVVGGPGDTEVDQPRTVARQQDVPGLDVAVREVGLMHGLYGGAQFGGE
jgi:hypothetical protein